MAIQMRRGQRADFDPAKMLPGEWAVSIDNDTKNQIVWMCFRAGVVKRMGTYEDFKAQIQEATGEIREEYLTEFNAVLEQIEMLAMQTQKNADTVIRIRDDTVNKYLPTMLGYMERSELSAASAGSSADEAKASETASEQSEAQAKISEQAAKTSEINSKSSEAASGLSEINAKESEKIATEKAEIAVQRADEALSAQENAAQSAKTAKQSEEAVLVSAGLVSESAKAAGESAELSQSYAVGTDGKVREADATDNAKYYAEQAKRVSEGLKGSLIPMGTIAFGDLPDTSISGYMYNISDSFTTTERFKEGAGHVIPSGANVYYTADGQWDVLAGTPVTGIKGNKETTYRRGNVNLTSEDIGTYNKDTIDEKFRSELEVFKKSILNLVYPIGAVYMSVSSTNPSALFGGTWIAWGAGRVPVGVSTADADFNAAEKAGGAKTHTLTTAQLPSHTHTVPAHVHSIGSHTHTFSGVGHHHTPNRTGYCFTINKTEGTDSVARRRVKLDSSSGAFAMTSYEPASDYAADDIHQATGTTDTVATGTIGSGGGGNTGNSSALTTSANGSGSAVNNVQPYITCYMWKRTA